MDEGYKTGNPAFIRKQQSKNTLQGNENKKNEEIKIR
jgi:hypothetical protein